MTGDDVVVTLARRGRGPDPGRYATAADRARATDLPERRAAEYLEGRALLRWLLDRVLGPPTAHAAIGVTATGKPVLDGDVGVSVSHGTRVLAAAVAPAREVGVDVQEHVVPTPGLLARCCRAEDVAAVAALAPAERARVFTAVWVVQEACLKAVGEGVRFRPGRVAVRPGRRRGAWRDLHWRLLPPYAGAEVAVAASGPPPRVHLLHPVEGMRAP
ncbi:4'-phosphopantetheinyl transferase family protein [Actinosynnema sp. NPDC059335]|uniref:4'-phosphopantetheinyl transferase family protein n=1 Tax=Actinosynnema sp. NPDC059335 TaxID=3346804 RepID=UPI00367235CB